MMRVIDCQQGSEQWDVLRMTRPTASEFDKIITPKTGVLSKSHRDYACELVAKQLGVFTEPAPSLWMEWGIENEPQAVSCYEQRAEQAVERVGFVLPDNTDSYGASPDGLLCDRTGVLEVKCPKPETLIRYHWDGTLPDDYRPQIQGLLLIAGCEYCDFFAWHPEVSPFLLRVEPDAKYQLKMQAALEAFCEAVEDLTQKVGKSGLNIIKWGE